MGCVALPAERSAGRDRRPQAAASELAPDRPRLHAAQGGELVVVVAAVRGLTVADKVENRHQGAAATS